MWMRALCIVGFGAMTMPAWAGAGASILPPPRHGGVYVVAHRGAHDGVPENSLAACQKAIELGADFVEVDARQTQDGHFVNIHNSTVDAYAEGATGAVHDLTLAEIQALDIGSRVGPEWAGTRIPTVDEVLALCKGKIGIYMDFKDGSWEDILALVKKHGMERQVLWYASNERLKKIREACPKCIIMPDPGPGANLKPLLEDLRPKVVAAVWRHYSESFVKTCHEAGAIVIVDEHDPSSWEPALAWKSDGIQTDHPEKLIEALKKRGQTQ